MSLTIIVLVSTVMAALIGLKIYFEYNQEKELEKQKQELEKEQENASRFTLEEFLASNQLIAIEEVPKNQLKLDFETPVESAESTAIVEVEPINSAAALAETKPKKNKHYYPKKKKAAIKAKPKKQTKK